MSGILTKDTVLAHSTDGTAYTEIPLLMEVPEFGGTSEKVEVTTLADSVKKYINGVRDLGDLAFKFLYDNSGATSNYRILKGVQDGGTSHKFKLTYPDGTSHAFEAQVSVKMDSGAVNAALTFTATMSLQSDITTTNPE